MNGEMKFQVQELRPEVLSFALLMEQRLREKDADKGDSWRRMFPAQLMVQASSKAIRLESLILSYAKHDEYLRHAIDLANYCMMIAGVVGGALELPEEQNEEWKRDDERTHYTLLLVGGHNVTPEAIASWYDEDCKLAEEWALCTHVQASDNDDVVVPRVPACVIPFLVR